jgi:hypothetical protein
MVVYTKSITAMTIDFFFISSCDMTNDVSKKAGSIELIPLHLQLIF